MKDYQLTVRVRNNRILSRIESAGYGSVAAFCRDYGLTYGSIARLIAMKKGALTPHGLPRTIAVNLASALDCNFEDLFNDRQLSADFNAVVTVREVSEQPLLSLEDCTTESFPSPEASCITKIDMHNLVLKLSPRYQRIITLHYGLDGNAPKSCEEIASAEGCSPARINQIKLKACREMKEVADRNFAI